MTETLTRRDVAHQARLFATEQGITEGHGSRGRVSKGVVLAYVQAQPAKTVREIAGALGVQIDPKGKISEAEYTALVEFVAGNAPKAEAPAEPTE